MRGVAIISHVTYVWRRLTEMRGVAIISQCYICLEEVN